MAVDGRKFSDTLRLGSDDWLEYPCSPCAREGRNVAAINHCVECDENLCSTCFNHHNKFPMMKRHQISDNLSSQTVKKKSELPVQRCDKHGGKLVDLYCPYHDSVGCAACIAVNHSSCREIKYIPEITGGIQTQKEVAELDTKLNNLITKLDRLKLMKQESLKLLLQEKGSLIKEIRVLRKQINDQLDKMEKVLLDDAESKFKLKIESANKAVDTIANMKSNVEKRQKFVQNAGSINEAELFVQVKLGNSSLLETERNLRLMDTNDSSPTMKLLPSNDIKTLLAQDNISFGQISEYYVAKSTQHIGDFTVRLHSDQLCWITDICVSSSGHFIITDLNNKRIKKLYQSYAVIEHLNLPDHPSRLCKIDSTHLAVTLRDHKKVQFVNQQPLKLGASFSVGDCCRGIDYLDGQLYVCCGGQREKGEGPGYIEIYSLHGVLLRSFAEGLNGPISIKCLNRENVFIADNINNSLLTLDMYSLISSEMPLKNAYTPVGFCKIGDRQLCIAGYRSQNIVLISEDGKQEQELLTEQDCQREPRAVCFDQKKSRLIVSFDDWDVIKVFDVFV